MAWGGIPDGFQSDSDLLETQSQLAYAKSRLEQARITEKSLRSLLTKTNTEFTVPYMAFTEEELAR